MSEYEPRSPDPFELRFWVAFIFVALAVGAVILLASNAGAI